MDGYVRKAINTLRTAKEYAKEYASGFVKESKYIAKHPIKTLAYLRDLLKYS